MTEIYFDLDEVLRSMNKVVFGKTNGRFNWEQNIKGQSFVEYVDEHLELLVTAPPTTYLKVVKKHFKRPKIATYQPSNWMPYTIKWLEKNLPDYDIYNLSGFGEKWDFVVNKQKGILVEDSPRLPSYKGVAIIDYYYNRHLTPTHFPEHNKPLKRFHTSAQLEKFIVDVM